MKDGLDAGVTLNSKLFVGKLNKMLANADCEHPKSDFKKLHDLMKKTVIQFANKIAPKDSKKPQRAYSLLQKYKLFEPIDLEQKADDEISINGESQSASSFFNKKAYLLAPVTETPTISEAKGKVTEERLMQSFEIDSPAL